MIFRRNPRTTVPSSSAQRSTGAATTHVYRPRTPERSVLYRLVQEHLATWLPRHKEDPNSQVPGYAKRELRAIVLDGLCQDNPEGGVRLVHADPIAQHTVLGVQQTIRAKLLAYVAARAGPTFHFQ